MTSMDSPMGAHCISPDAFREIDRLANIAFARAMQLGEGIRWRGSTPDSPTLPRPAQDEEQVGGFGGSTVVHEEESASAGSLEQNLTGKFLSYFGIPYARILGFSPPNKEGFFLLASYNRLKITVTMTPISGVPGKYESKGTFVLAAIANHNYTNPPASYKRHVTPDSDLERLANKVSLLEWTVRQDRMCPDIYIVEGILFNHSDGMHSFFDEVRVNDLARLVKYCEGKPAEIEAERE